MQVDVLVHDRAGEPVLDLAKEDFELYQDGEAVPVAGFTPPADPRRRARPVQLAIVLQRAFLEPGELAGLTETLRAFVEGLDPEIQVMLVDADSGPRLLSPPEAGRKALLARLETLEEGTVPDPLASEAAALLSDLRRQARQGLDDRFLPTGGAQIELLRTRIGAFAERAWRQLESSMAPLHRFLDVLAGRPGRREVLLVGGRLPATVGQSLYDVWRRTFGRSSPFWAGIAANPGGGEESSSAGIEFETLAEGAEFLDTSPLLEALVRHAAAVGVTLHSLDAGSRGGRRGAAEIHQASDARVLRSLAEDTGGRGVSRGTALEASLAALGRDLAASYVLAFAPPQGPDGELHDLRIVVPSRRRVEVRHRPAVRARSRDEETARRLVAALWLGGGGNPLEVEAAELAEAGDAGKTAVGEPAAGLSPAQTGPPLRLAVHVPLARLALVPDGTSHRGRLSIFTTASAPGDAFGSTGAVARSVVPVSLANEEILASQGRTVEVFVEIPSPGPGGRVAVAVRDDFQDVTSLVTLTVGAGGEVAGWAQPPPGSEG